MKRQFLAIPLLLIAFLFSSAKSVGAITSCDPGTGSPCTICTYDIASNTCKVSSSSTCTYSNYLDNSSFCTDQDPSTCMAREGSNFGDCLPTPTATVTITPTGTVTITPSISPPGTYCFRCNTLSTGCDSILISSGASLCQYYDREVCESACSGQTTVMYSCKNNSCTEDQYGTYDSPNCDGTCNNYPVGKNEVFCITGDKDSGIMTAIGCINTADTNSFIASILRVATGIGGGLALAMILYGVFIVTTSAGIPDKLKAGSEIITSAIIGLIFILLSVVLLNIIGINILGLPGLS